MCSAVTARVRASRRWIVTVIPVQALRSPAAVESTTPRLRLVAPHEHTWQLRGVEYDDTFEVRRYECDTCDDVMYR